VKKIKITTGLNYAGSEILYVVIVRAFAIMVSQSCIKRLTISALRAIIFLASW
jgi:hypothetical protein